jgi:hypothetical protein
MFKDNIQILDPDQIVAHTSRGGLWIRQVEGWEFEARATSRHGVYRRVAPNAPDAYCLRNLFDAHS